MFKSKSQFQFQYKPNFAKIFLLCLVLLSFNITTNSYAASSKEKESSRTEMSGEEEGEEESFEEKIKMSLNRMAAKNYSNVEQAVYFFESMGENAVSYLIEKLESDEDNKRVRNNIIYTFGRLGKNAKRAVPNIIKYLKSNDSDTRGVAVVALGKIGKYSKNAVPTLILLLKDRDSWVQEKASEALKKIGGKKVK